MGIAAERAADVRFADPDPRTLELRPMRVEAELTENTRWVALTAASNAVGTVPDVEGIVAAAHDAGARVYVDAVHASPAPGARRHAVDVARLLGVQVVRPAHRDAVCRPALLETLRPDKLIPSPDEVPDRFELGTLPFESLAGVGGRRAYLRSLDWDAVARTRTRCCARALRRPRGASTA